MSSLKNFEAWLWGKKLDQNTIQSNMTTVLSILNKAEKMNLIERKQYKQYSKPKYIQKIPEYLTEKEIEMFF